MRVKRRSLQETNVLIMDHHVKKLWLYNTVANRPYFRVARNLYLNARVREKPLIWKLLF